MNFMSKKLVFPTMENTMIDLHGVPNLMCIAGLSARNVQHAIEVV